MKIAFHFPCLASGGVEKMRIILAAELIRRGIDVDFVVCTATGEYLDQIPAGVNIIDLGAPRTRNSLLPLVRYLRKSEPDHLVSSLGPQNIIAILAKKIARVSTRVHVTQHNALSRQSSIQATLQQKLVPFAYRLLLPYADGVIAVSRGIAEDMATSTGFPLSNIRVIYNPAYTAAPAEGFLPDELEGTRYILSIGRLVHQKGFDDLIRAFSIVRDDYPELNLAILGNGPLEHELSQLILESGLTGKVHLMGFRRNPSTYMQGADLFVLASRYEGFGNVLVEALSVGTPVVSTNCDYGPDEILKDGKYGALVPVGDIHSMAKSIKDALASPHDHESLRARAADFTPEAIVNKYLEVLTTEHTL